MYCTCFGPRQSSSRFIPVSIPEYCTRIVSVYLRFKYFEVLCIKSTSHCVYRMLNTITPEYRCFEVLHHTNFVLHGSKQENARYTDAWRASETPLSAMQGKIHNRRNASVFNSTRWGSRTKYLHSQHTAHARNVVTR